jgi:hypothetical protein
MTKDPQARDGVEDALFVVRRPRWIIFGLSSLHVIGLIIIVVDMHDFGLHVTLGRIVGFAAALGGVHAINDVSVIATRTGITVRNPVFVRIFGWGDIVQMRVRQGLQIRIRPWRFAFTVSAASNVISFRGDKPREVISKIQGALDSGQVDMDGLAAECHFKRAWVPYVFGLTLAYSTVTILYSAIVGRA